jgi:hypothetical protein
MQDITITNDKGWAIVFDHKYIQFNDAYFQAHFMQEPYTRLKDECRHLFFPYDDSSGTGAWLKGYQTLQLLWHIEYVQHGETALLAAYVAAYRQEQEEYKARQEEALKRMKR